MQRSAYIEVFIPSGFEIRDAQRVASSCTAIQGFSDELTCEWVRIEERKGSRLKVLGGFTSSTFEGGMLTFTLSEIMNPLTTEEESDGFHASIYDSEGDLLYGMNSEIKVPIRPSPFAFAFIKPGSERNGDYCEYTVSVTLSVDTQVGAKLSI